MLIAFINVIGEKLAKAGVPVSGITYFSDWIAYLHVPVCWLAAGFVTLERGHTVVDILSNKLHHTLKLIVSYFGRALGIVVSCLLAYRAWFFLLPDSIRLHTTISSSSFSFPEWPFIMLYAIGCAALIFSFIWSLVRLACHMKRPYEQEFVVKGKEGEKNG